MQDPEEIRRELQRILLSPEFLHSDRLRRFLTHCVESTLAGRVDDLKEYTIGLEVFDRDPSYDPRLDSTVRVRLWCSSRECVVALSSDAREPTHLRAKTCLSWNWL